ncbi:MAG: hypothetical protein QGG36_32720 [Pirellulaceae bacterium]|jgi:hypothetical protein|nr:hypothetical protein [Pirellulaceae bacterium]
MMKVSSTTRYLIAGSLVFSLSTTTARGYAPEDELVRGMVGRGIRYLESKSAFQQPHVGRLGGICLIALAIHKGSRDHDENHPIVRAAITRCLAEAAKPTAALQQLEDSNYSLGIATVFLCEVDAQKHRPAIDKFLAALWANQQAGGGWGYVRGSEADGLGDTSQTQYGVLASWTAQHEGVPVEAGVFERAARWLLRTQDIGGAHAYKPRDQGQRIAQASRKTLSLTAAGAGSNYICGDALNLFAGELAKEKARQLGPLREVGAAAAELAPRSSLSPAAVLAGTAAADRWFDSRLALNGGDSFYYMLYAIERYMTFRDRAHGRDVAAPLWYNAGVDYCRRAQNAQGGFWETPDGGRAIPTAFAILFLIRSTHTSLEVPPKHDGLLAGGGPDQLEKILNNDFGSDGKPVNPETPLTFDQVLTQLSQGDFAIDDIPVQLPPRRPDVDTTKRDAVMELLKQRVSHPDPQMRLAVVKLIASNAKMDEVPALLYALRDPDHRVVRAARDGLRFVSRKIEGFGLSDRPTEAERVQAKKAWTRWYRRVRPDGKLVVE